MTLTKGSSPMVHMNESHKDFHPDSNWPGISTGASAPATLLNFMANDPHHVRSEQLNPSRAALEIPP